MLTPEQVDLLGWIVESGSGEVLHVPTGNDPKDVAIIPNHERRRASPMQQTFGQQDFFLDWGRG